MTLLRLFARPRQWLALPRTTSHLLTRHLTCVDSTRVFLLAAPNTGLATDNLRLHSKVEWRNQESNLICSRRFASSIDETKAEAAPDDGVIIYRGSLNKQIYLTKFCSLSSSLVGFALQPYLYTTFGSAHVAVIIALASTVGVFTYVTPFLLHWVTKRYVAEMSFNRAERVFTVTTFTFFMRNKKTKFLASDVHIPDVPGPFTSMLVKNKPIFFDPKEFMDADAFAHLMGYDKPLDLKLGFRPAKEKVVEDETAK